MTTGLDDRLQAAGLQIAGVAVRVPTQSRVLGRRRLLHRGLLGVVLLLVAGGAVNAALVRTTGQRVVAGPSETRHAGELPDPCFLLSSAEATRIAGEDVTLLRSPPKAGASVRSCAYVLSPGHPASGETGLATRAIRFDVRRPENASRQVQAILTRREPGLVTEQLEGLGTIAVRITGPNTEKVVAADDGLVYDLGFYGFTPKSTGEATMRSVLLKANSAQTTASSDAAFLIAAVESSSASTPCAAPAVPGPENRCYLLGDTLVTAADVTNAKVGADPGQLSGSGPYVTLELSRNALARLNEFAAQHENSQIALVLSGQVIAAPPIRNGPFTGSVDVTVPDEATAARVAKAAQ